MSDEVFSDLEREALKEAWNKFLSDDLRAACTFEDTFSAGWNAALSQPAGIFSGPTVREALHLLIAAIESVTTCPDVKIVTYEAKDGE